MKRTGRARSGARPSPRIINAPPKLMISQATRKLTASCRPNTPTAPMRLTAAPKVQLDLRCVGLPSQEANIAPGIPNPISQRASGVSVNKELPIPKGNEIVGDVAGSVPTATSRIATPPITRSQRAGEEARPVKAKMPATTHAATPTANTLFAKAASMDALRHSVQEHQKGFDHRSGIGWTARQIKINRQDTIQAVAARVSACGDTS